MSYGTLSASTDQGDCGKGGARAGEGNVAPDAVLTDGSKLMSLANAIGLCASSLAWTILVATSELVVGSASLESFRLHTHSM